VDTSAISDKDYSAKARSNLPGEEKKYSRNLYGKL
jgi:hypothetical protein